MTGSQGKLCDKELLNGALGVFFDDTNETYFYPPCYAIFWTQNFIENFSLVCSTIGNFEFTPAYRRLSPSSMLENRVF